MNPPLVSPPVQSHNNPLTDILGLRQCGIFSAGKEPSVRTLREWTKLRRIPHHRVGHFVYYDALSARGRLWATPPTHPPMPRKRKTKVQAIQPVINPHAAGADIGALEICVAVPTALTTEAVRCFPTFTEDLRALVAWLQSFGIKTVAMEAASFCAWPPRRCITPRTNSANTTAGLRAKLGGAAAVTALADKLARILYVLITTRQPYRPDLHAATGELHRIRSLARLKAKAHDLGFQLVPTPASA